jgi:hypothetical protein
MFIEFKTKRDIENRERIQEYYDSFEKIFKEKQNKSLIRSVFNDNDTRSCITKKILSSIKNKQIVCHHSWGRNGTLIFQINLSYFHYTSNNKEYVYGIGYQLQESTIKINCARASYNESVTDEIADIIPIFIKNKNSIFNRIGLPKTHAYISMTKKIDNINQYSINELCDYLYELLINSMDLINSIKKDIKNIGGKFFKYYAIENNGL